MSEEAAVEFILVVAGFALAGLALPLTVILLFFLSTLTHSSTRRPDAEP